MRLRNRFASIYPISLLATLIFVFLVFILFVYPSPGGILFTTLKLLVLLVFGLVFYEYNVSKHRKEKSNTARPESVPAPSEQVSASREYSLGSEEMVLFTDYTRNILDLIEATFPDFNVALYMVNDSRTALIRQGSSGEPEIFSRTLSLQGSSFEELIGAEGPKFFTVHSGIEAIKGIFRDASDVNDSVAVLVCPFSAERSRMGLLAIQADEYSHFEEKDKETISYFCGLVSKELKRIQALNALRSQDSFLSHLYAFQNDLDITKSQEELLSELVRFCDRSFPYDKLTISLRDNSNPREAVFRVVSGFTMDYVTGDRFPVGASVIGKVMSEGIPVRYDNLVLAQDVKGRFREGDIEEYQFMSLIAVPIRHRSAVLGALALESLASHKYTESDLKMLGVVGQNIGTLLSWSENYAFVKMTATQDGLTGLLNHRAFLERFDEELRRAERYQQNAALLMLDLDKFKRINDSYGHLYGDYVLVETAKVLRKSVRNIDIVARYGGEEFAIILVNTTKEDILGTSKRVVMNVATYDFNKDGIAVRMTISAGASEYPSDGETVREMIARADEAMYDVKRRGGNDVALAATTSSS